MTAASRRSLKTVLTCASHRGRGHGDTCEARQETPPTSWHEAPPTSWHEAPPASYHEAPPTS